MPRELRTALLLAPAFLAIAVLVWIGDPAADPARPAELSVEEPLPAPVIATPPPAFQPVMLRVRNETSRPVVPALDEPEVFVPKSTIDALANARDWSQALRCFYGLPAVDSDGAALERLQALFARTTDPVVRQNLLFLAALALPPDIARPWLEAVQGSADRDGIYEPDREDALVALAFSDQGSYAATFEALASKESRAYVHRLVDRIEDHGGIGRAGGHDARETLRAYRAIEVLDRQPYFKIQAYLAPLDWHQRGWKQTTSTTQARLLEAWLRRYPGHPGSDDMALRLARYAITERRYVDAARWFSRAATLPDQDVAYGARDGLISCCELLLTPAQLDALANEDGDLTPNRQLILYVRARRIAARAGFQAALDVMDDVRRYEDPFAPLVEGWEQRWSGNPPRGLGSGLVPLDPSDELHRRAPSPTRAPPLTTHRARTWMETRLVPDPEVQALWPGRLASQFRLWETLATLERRTERAQGHGRADLLYKQAAVFYHQPDVLFPAYAWHTHRFVSMLRGAGLRLDEPADLGRAHQHFEGQTYSLHRALRLFARIEREHPNYPAMDRVLFSKAMAWKRLADYKPHYDWFAVPKSMDPDDRRDGAVRRLVETFKTLIARFPQSSLADDARRAIGYWRATRARAFR